MTAVKGDHSLAIMNGGAEVPAAVAAWHRVVSSGDPALLADVLADDVVFRSPAVHQPQEGRAITTAYLVAALVVLGPELTYRRQWYGDDSAVLEFETVVDGMSVHGVDLLRWNAEDRLVEFTVMVRPLRGLQAVLTRMGEQLAGQ